MKKDNNIITINYYGETEDGQEVAGTKSMNHQYFCNVFNQLLRITKPQYDYLWVDENDFELHSKFFSNYKYECLNTTDTEWWMKESLSDDDVFDLVHDFAWTLHEDLHFPFMKDTTRDDEYYYSIVNEDGSLKDESEGEKIFEEAQSRVIEEVE